MQHKPTKRTFFKLMIYFEKCVFRLFMFHNYKGTVVMTLTDISIETGNTNGYLNINLCNSKLAFMSVAQHVSCVQQNIEDTDYNMLGGRAGQRPEPFSCRVLLFLTHN